MRLGNAPENGALRQVHGLHQRELQNTRKILRNGDVAPPKEDPVPLPELPCEKSDAYFVLRDGAAGVFGGQHLP